ncbi:response regulator transcription factor [Hyphomonas sp. FCG-A18]|uniref:response regulator n=1 Tax=Hyphomonas sp. FCG-A18 TaxID=3080019 RepID=UPI002B2FD788|nr:response regulator transcription factor [Hyphomonas sp. FCG-A18]
MIEAQHLLIVDDDDRIRDLLKKYLGRQGYKMTVAADAKAARKLFQTFSFDLAILDIMMPGEDGLSLLSALRQDGNQTPVLLLTARGNASDRIEGLKLGADDYLPKPFEPEELSLRVAAILRRTHMPEPPGEVEMSGLVFDVKRGVLTGPEGAIRLTDGELQLLTLMAQQPGEAFSREGLAEQTSNGSERSIDVQVTRLRKKIEPDPKNPIHLQTVRGIGYRLMPD